MEEPTTPPTPPPTPTTLRWNQDRERRRLYHVAYYLKSKAARPPPPPRKKGLVDWSNPVEVAALKRAYAAKTTKCSACGKLVRACSITHHRRSNFHLLGVALQLKGGSAGLDTGL